MAVVPRLSLCANKAGMKHERIEMNPAVMAGKPVIRGTRVPVSMILDELGAGMTPEQIVVEHPTIALKDIQAAQAFAADYIRNDEIIYG